MLSAFCEPLEQSLPDQRAPAGAAGLVHSRLEQELQSFRPSRAGLLLWRRLQGFAKSAHPWLSSHRPAGAEYVTVFMKSCTKPELDTYAGIKHGVQPLGCSGFYLLSEQAKA